MIYKSKISNCSKPVSEEKNSARISLLLIFISSGLHVLPIFRLWLTLQKPWFHDASMLIRLRMYFHLLYLQSIQLSGFLHLPFHSHTQATRGLSLGRGRSSQWGIGGIRLSPKGIVLPGCFGQDRIPEQMDVLRGTRKCSCLVNVVIRRFHHRTTWKEMPTNVVQYTGCYLSADIWQWAL